MLGIQHIKGINSILWGLAFIWLDFTIRQDNLKFDFINDIIGAFLLYKGVSIFENCLPENDVYIKNNFWIFLACKLTIVIAFIDFIYFKNTVALIRLFFQFIDIVIAYGFLLFCRNMKIISRSNHFSDLYEQWHKSEMIVFYLNLIPSFISSLILLFITILNPFKSINFSMKNEPVLDIVFFIFVIMYIVSIIYIIRVLIKTRDKIENSINY